MYIQPILSKFEREMQFEYREKIVGWGLRIRKKGKEQKSHVLEVSGLKPRSQFNVFLFITQSVLISESRLILSQVLSLIDLFLICRRETWLDSSVKKMSVPLHHFFCEI